MIEAIGGLMEIPSYVFQSPYPTAVQVGRPDPQVAVESNDSLAGDALSSAGNDTLKEAETYQFQSTSSSVNVAVSSVDSGVSASLDTFSSLNNQIQASEAYSVE